MTTAATDIIEHIGRLQDLPERIEVASLIDRNTLIRVLDVYGFGRSGTAPSDWRTYFSDDELRVFVLEYVEQFSPAL